MAFSSVTLIIALWPKVRPMRPNFVLSRLRPDSDREKCFLSRSSPVNANLVCCTSSGRLSQSISIATRSSSSMCHNQTLPKLPISRTSPSLKSQTCMGANSEVERNVIILFLLAQTTLAGQGNSRTHRCEVCISHTVRRCLPEILLDTSMISERIG